jgi:acetyl esterase/lipase
MPSTHASPLDIPLWPARAHPAMRIYFPDADRAHPRPALVILRGGGYARCDGSGGGSGVWAARNGMVGIEVEYGTRSTQASYPAPYADAARSVRLVRSHAREWGIDPGRVGVLGYSAGGHLATLLSTQPALWVAPADDLAPRMSARPDLVVLAYPVISFVDHYEPGAFVGSVENFFGRGDLDEPLRRQFSSELHVDSTHPPVFMWTTADDALVPAAHAERVAEACRRAHVPVAFTLYPHGPHAMGLALDQPSPVGKWTTHLLAWLTERWGQPRRSRTPSHS